MTLKTVTTHSCETYNSLKIIRPFTVLILIIGVLPLTPVKGQDTVPDTVFVKRTVGPNEVEIDTLFIPGGRSSTQVLAGTTFLPNSDKMIGLLNSGLSPISLEIVKECNNSIDQSTYKEYPKFITATRESDILTIEVSVIANCCHNFLGEAEVKGKDTLNLIYKSYGGFCSCNCGFTLRYMFDATMEANYQVLKYVTINNSPASSQITNAGELKEHHLKNIRYVLEDYIQYEESTDSPEDKKLMTESLNSLSVVTNPEELELLINVWMYYDPTDFPDIPEVYRILKDSRPHSIEAVKKRIDNRKDWENPETAPYSDLQNLLKRLENE